MAETYELYPSQQMDAIGHLLEAGAQRLRESAIALMQDNYCNPTPAQIAKLEKIRKACATLDIDWVLQTLQDSTIFPYFSLFFLSPYTRFRI
jgi:hypothetical protein